LRLAIFGGTFDPIHEAHLAVARAAAARCALDQVLFVPAARPPHKTGATQAPYEDRVTMIELACQDEPRFVSSRLEQGAARSYSIRTIEAVRVTLAPGGPLFFLIGADAFAEIRTWLRWRDVLAAVEFIVASRPGHSYQTPPGARVHRLDTLALAISSSEVRRRLARGAAHGALPPAVLAYIRQRGLYAAPPG